MKLHRLTVEHVRGLAHASVDLAPTGVTVIEAPNESGKTTLLDAFDLLLHEKDSTRKQAVRDLQPVGQDVGSFVEAELSCGPVHLTVRKRFNRQTMTELEVHAPQRQQLTGDDAHAHLRDLLGQHTDLALYEALRFRQGRALDSVTLGASGSLARRLDEIAGGTGDGGDDALLDRVRQEFERYYTPKGHDGKVLKDAEADVTAARAHRDELAATADALEADVARIEQLTREQREATDELATLEPQLAEHRQRRDRVARLREQLATLEARAEAADAEVERRRRDRDERVELAGEVDDAERTIAADEPAVARARQRLTDRQQRLSELAEQVHAAEQRELEAREARDAAKDLAELGRRRRELEALRARWHRIEQAQEDARAAEAALAANPVDDDQFSVVRDADEAVRVAEARLGDAAPVVTVTAHRDLQVEVDGDVRTLGAGEVLEEPVPEAWQVSLAEHLDVAVRSGTSLADRQAELVRAREQLAAACRQVGVEDKAAADALAEEQRAHRRALEERDRLVERELEGATREELDQLLRTRSAELDGLESRIQDREDGQAPQLTLDVDAAEDRLVELEAAEAAARRDADQARRERDALAAEVQQLEGQVTVSETELAGRRRRWEELRTELAAERERADDARLEQRLSQATEAAEEAHEAVAAVRTELDELGADEVELLAANHEQRLEGTRQRLSELSDELTKLQVGVELRGGEGIGEALQAADAELRRLEEQQRRLEARARAARTLLRAFEQARDAAYAAYREPLRERIVRSGRVVFGDDLDVDLDEQLTVVARHLGGTRLTWDQLSAGAREQLAILTALAAADLAGRDGSDGVPLVLDDTLGYTDPSRLERLGAVLGAVQGPQVLVLTCVGERFRAIGGAQVVRLQDRGRTG